VVLHVKLVNEGGPENILDREKGGAAWCGVA
jgi:hypothetical protein